MDDKNIIFAVLALLDDLEALAVDNARTGIVIFLPCDDHLRERR
jgi:hypothetical protein